MLLDCWESRLAFLMTPLHGRHAAQSKGAWTTAILMMHVWADDRSTVTGQLSVAQNGEARVDEKASALAYTAVAVRIPKGTGESLPRLVEVYALCGL